MSRFFNILRQVFGIAQEFVADDSMGGKRTFKREIVAETRQIILIQRSKGQSAIFCDRCTLRSPMIAPAIATQFLGLSQREIFGRIEAGTIHFAENCDGNVLVCVYSLRDKPAIQERLGS